MNALKAPTPQKSQSPEVPIPKVLAVDDHRPNLIALEAILDPLALDVVTVTSGEDALIEVLRNDFALILMDVQMPGLDGFATTSLIKKRQRSKHVPIIFLTAISREERHITQGYNYGAVDYLVKPFDPSVLRAKVGVFVDLWRQKQHVQRQERDLLQREREALHVRGDVRFHTLAEAVLEVVWAVDPAGNVIFANEAAKSAFGELGGPESVLSMPELHPDDAAAVQDRWRASLLRGERFEWKARMRDATSGEHRPWRGQALPERDEKGAVSGWIVVLTPAGA